MRDEDTFRDFESKEDILYIEGDSETQRVTLKLPEGKSEVTLNCKWLKTLMIRLEYYATLIKENSGRQEL